MDAGCKQCIIKCLKSKSLYQALRKIHTAFKQKESFTGSFKVFLIHDHCEQTASLKQLLSATFFFISYVDVKYTVS